MMGKEQGLQPNLFYANFNIDQRVRKDHQLRKIKKLIDFDFIYQEVKDYYGSILWNEVLPRLPGMGLSDLCGVVCGEWLFKII